MTMDARAGAGGGKQSGRGWIDRWGIPTAVFLVSFVFRVTYPISRPMVWTDRAFHFFDAILRQDWPVTYQQYHPGVPVMWLSGAALQLFARRNGNLTADQLLGVDPTKPGTLVDALQAAVLPVALVVAACIALSYILLKRLAGRRIALAGALLIALDPFYIGNAKVIQPDTLMATFMIVSALFLLVFIKERRWSMLVLSGLFGGLSVLSKSPGLFLLPYAGLALSTAAGVRWRDKGAAGNLGEARAAIWWVFRSLALWSVAVMVIYFVLWPAMWVGPLGTLRAVVDGVSFHSENPHFNPIFFNSKVLRRDPGAGYYLATIGWKTTLVSLPFAIAAMFFAARRRRGARSWTVWAMLAYVVFFAVQMSLGAFKQMHYLLPLFPAIDIMAGIGLVWAAAAIAKAIAAAISGEPAGERQVRASRRLANLLIAAVLGVQAIIALAAYPYYGEHFNRLLGGAGVGGKMLPVQVNGEGLELAARFLNSLPHGQDETAALYPIGASVFRREFEGRTELEPSPLARYRVYYANHLMRAEPEDEWRQLWQAEQESDPLFTVQVNGITYVWVYGQRPEDPAAGGPALELDYGLGEHIRLREARFESDTVRPGEALTAALLWESDGEVAGDYTVFTHLLSAEGELIAQQDNVPLGGIRPTFTWRAGERLEDVYRLEVPGETVPGEYVFSLGMYDAETGQRVPAFDGAGERLPEDRIVAGRIRVGEH